MISAELPALTEAHAVLAGLAQALPDTIVTVQAKSTGWQLWVDTLTSIASVVIALALIAIAVPVIPAAWNSRKMYARVNKAIERFRGDLDPAVRHLSTVAENLNYITTAVREDVRQVNALVNGTTERLNRTAELAEERLRELNALLAVAQEEAESLFIGAASAARGVQAGAEAFSRLQGRKGRGRVEYDDELLDEDELEDDEELFDDEVYAEEAAGGYDGEDDEDDEAEDARDGRWWR